MERGGLDLWLVATSSLFALQSGTVISQSKAVYLHAIGFIGPEHMMAWPIKDDRLALGREPGLRRTI